MAPHGDADRTSSILTVLSQSTNDRNRDVAFLRLRERFRSWEAVRDAPIAEVEEAIRPGGISKVKSVRIQAILRAIGEGAGCRSRAGSRGARARGARVPRALPGVGRKTAACVLLFAYGLRDVPVDTHVSRVGTRLHLLRAARSSTRCTTRCSPSRRRAQELELHVNLLRHGRRTCHARRPRCRACALRRMCPSAQLLTV